jgi:hypothetical protein
MTDFFKGKTAWLASKHQKENWIGPVLEANLGLTLTPIPSFDSDKFGTFGGDVERPGNQWETALQKLEFAKEMMAESSLFICSEGAFFPHPEMPFLTQNLELIVLKDFENSVLIRGQNVESGFPLWEKELKEIHDLEQIIQTHNFREAGLILKAKKGKDWLVFKDFDRPADLEDAFFQALKSVPSVFISPDLRAHQNVQRQKNLQKAALDLARNAHFTCPDCKSPGFSTVKKVSGLPCGWCGLPTRLPKAEISSCFHCGFEEERQISEKEADPGFCLFCNP